MELATLLLFIPACFALNLSPGPNNLVALSNASRYGFRSACAAGIGRIVAFLLMIAIAAFGLAAVLYTSEVLFLVIKVGGACYLFYMALKLWRAGSLSEQQEQPKVGLYALAKQEFLLAIGNPKAILIFTAFLPQFVDPSRPVAAQFILVGGLFLLLEWLAIAGYAFIGAYLRQWFSQPKARQMFNRTCSAFLATAGIGLLLSRRTA